MSRLCDNCKFADNTNTAHFCAKCGSRLPGVHDWRVYDSTVYASVAKSELKRLQDLAERPDFSTERLSLRAEIEQLKRDKQSLQTRNTELQRRLSASESRVRSLQSSLNSERRRNRSVWSRIKDFFKKDWVDDVLAYGGFVIGAFVVIYLLVAGMKSCGDDKSKGITRIKVGDKWGIGYDSDRLLVNAEYDSISSLPRGEQWELYDAEGKMGLAYVTDSVVRTISPMAPIVRLYGYGNRAVLNLENGTKLIAREGNILNSDNPYDSIRIIGRYSDNGGFLAMTKKPREQWRVLDMDGRPTSTSLFEYVYVYDDSTVVARSGSHNYHFFDGSGRKHPRSYYDHYSFSNGMCWVFVTENDYKKSNRRTLVTHDGRVVFTTPSGTTSTINYNGRVAWYTTGRRIWHAINAQGEEVRQEHGLTLRDVGSGLTAVGRGDNWSKISWGVVDDNGRTVIPFEYDDISGDSFSCDSTIRAMRNGAWGRLHINGSFTPDKK